MCPIYENQTVCVMLVCTVIVYSLAVIEIQLDSSTMQRFNRQRTQHICPSERQRLTTDACGKQLIGREAFLNGINEHPVNTNQESEPCDDIDATASPPPPTPTPRFLFCMFCKASLREARAHPEGSASPQTLPHLNSLTTDKR